MLQPKAATDNWYKVQLPDGTEGFVLENAVNRIDGPVRNVTVNTATALFDKPDSLQAARKSMIPQNEKVEVLGVFKDYFFVRNGKESGWMVK